MKTILATAALLAGCAATQAAVDFSAATMVNQAIPDGSATGMASTIGVNVNGDRIVPGSLSVSLNIAGSWSGDLYAYLAHGAGFTVLLNRVGVSPTDSLGYGDSGMSVLFGDSAANGNIHFYRNMTTPASGVQLTGSWAPDGRAVSPYAVQGTETPAANLSSFDGTDPNGQWTLFVADVNGGDLHTLTSWGMQFTAVPEPGTMAAGVFASLLLFLRPRRGAAGTL